MNVTRSDLKRNFLKNIIIKLDFQGAVNLEIEKIIPLIKEYLINNKFEKYNEKIQKEVRFYITAQKDSREPVIKHDVAGKIYSFSSSDGFSIDISNSYVSMLISPVIYVPFEKYITIFENIVKEIKKGIPMISLIKFGIRKRNVCILNNKDDLRLYFNDVILSMDKTIESMQNNITQRSESFVYDNINFNLMTAIQEKPTSYIVQIDIDGYVNGSEAINSTLDSHGVLINDKIFDVYISTLKTNMIDLLIGDDDKLINNVEGINENEE